MRLIPRIPPDAPAITTPKGPYRPERCILLSRPFLLYWHYDPVRSGHSLDEADLAGLRKTASRIDALLRSTGIGGFVPLAWPQPEVILFRLEIMDNREVHADIEGQLIQAERAWYVEEIDAIEFSRC